MRSRFQERSRGGGGWGVGGRWYPAIFISRFISYMYMHILCDFYFIVMCMTVYRVYISQAILSFSLTTSVHVDIRINYGLTKLLKFRQVCTCDVY